MTDIEIMPEELTPHVLRRSIVVEDARILYVPTPKSACTSIMWGLAGLAGLLPERFLGSISHEPTSDLTIHDMERWDDELRLIKRTPEDQARILNDHGWFRFTIVRDPVPRVWSAWQSKVLVREPWMTRLYAGRSWFPTGDPSPQRIIDWYRGFLRYLDAATIDGDLPTLDDATDNPHWLPQTVLLGESGMKLFRVGKLEGLEQTLEDLEKHIADHGGTGFAMHRANTSRLPYDRGLLDADGLATLRRLYRADFERLGYEPPAEDAIADGGLDEWRSSAVLTLPAVRLAIEHNERFDVVQLRAVQQQRTIERLSENLEDNKRWLKAANATVERLNAKVERLNAQVERLNAQVKREQHQVGNLKSQVTDARAREAGARNASERVVRDLEDRLAASKTNARFAEARAQDASTRAEEAHRELDAVRGHWSWRILRPLSRGRRRSGQTPSRRGRWL